MIFLHILRSSPLVGTFNVFLICIIPTWIRGGLHGYSLGNIGLKGSLTRCHLWTLARKPPRVYFLSLTLECQSWVLTHDTCSRPCRTAVMWCYILDRMPPTLLCHRPSSEQEPAVECAGRSRAVSSGRGDDGAACSPCLTLHLGPLKPFLIAPLWSRPASSYSKHSSYTHRISLLLLLFFSFKYTPSTSQLFFCLFF